MPNLKTRRDDTRAGMDLDGRSVVTRRALLAGVVAIVVTPCAAEAQPTDKVYRIGSLTRGGRQAAAPYNRALEEGLSVLGWVDGRNVVFEHRYADLKPER